MPTFRARNPIDALIMRLRAFARHPGDQERMLATLAASEAKFSGILAIAADAIITVDESERIVHFNEGAAVIFGYAIEEAIGRQLDILLPKRVRDVHHSHMLTFATSAVHARRMGERRAIFGLRRDGTEFPAEASISKLDGPDGPLFTVVLRDITDRRRAEKDERFLALAATEAARSLDYTIVLQTIVDLAVPRLADAAILDVIKRDGSIQRSASGSGETPRSLLLREIARAGLGWESPSPIIDVIRRGRAETFVNIDDDWIEGHEEMPLVAAWRTVGPHAMHILPLIAAGVPIGALTLLLVEPKRVFTSEGISLAEKFALPIALSLANAELYGNAQRANRAREDLLGVVSHDLRNPLSAIGMCARVLRETPPTSDAERTALLSNILESVEAMNRLIQDLVDVASIERGQLSLERVATESGRLIERAIHIFEVEAAGHEIALVRDVAADLPNVQVDEARIVQVLANLIRNAIKFTPDRGRIAVSAAAVDGVVKFSVADTGRGIEPSLHDRIFERYWESSAGARKPGTGLGLSIARGIVEAHGGRLSVESDVGVGSTFSFTVPVAPELGRTEASGIP
jgi:PAS domain S-box-containing protein